jgi:uncharacterized Fe-S cluster protein YjdI
LRQHQWTCVGTQADIFRVTKRSPWIYLSATGHPCSSLIFLSQCSL